MGVARVMCDVQVVWLVSPKGMSTIKLIIDRESPATFTGAGLLLDVVKGNLV